MVGEAIGFPPGGGGEGGDVDGAGLEAFAGQNLFKVGGRGEKVEPADFVEGAVAAGFQDADALGDGILDDAPEDHGGAAFDERDQPKDKPAEKKDGQSFAPTSEIVPLRFHLLFGGWWDSWDGWDEWDGRDGG